MSRPSDDPAVHGASEKGNIMSSATPLADLRRVLSSRGLEGMLVPRADAYQSEDCAPHDNKLEFLSGFTGSAGLALVLQDFLRHIILESWGTKLPCSKQVLLLVE